MGFVADAFAPLTIEIDAALGPSMVDFAANVWRTVRTELTGRFLDFIDLMRQTTSSTTAAGSIFHDFLLSLEYLDYCI
jgi:hypothetical protein